MLQTLFFPLEKNLRMSSVRRIIDSPLADVTDLPSVLNQEDLQLVAANICALFQKLLYGFKRNLVAQVSVVLYVVSECINHSLASLEDALAITRGEEGIAFLCEIISIFLSAGRDFDSVKEYCTQMMKLTHFLCNDITVKEYVGSRLPSVLLCYMEDVDAHNLDSYEINRSCASLVIELMHGSPANKNRLSFLASKGLGNCIHKTGDYYFQMQCVEVLFRLHLHNPSVFLEQNTSLGGTLRDSIGQLQNDVHLLSQIRRLLDAFNSQQSSIRIHQIEAVHLVAAGSEVNGNVSMQFSRSLLVIILSDAPGNHVTIPYEHIRSVKLSKDNRLGIRLHVIPEKLSLIMSLEKEGGDMIHALLTSAALNQLRCNRIHQWILDRKKLMSQTNNPQTFRQISLNRKFADSLPSAAAGPHQEKQKQNEKDEGIKRPQQPSPLDELSRSAQIKSSLYQEDRDQRVSQTRESVSAVLEEMHRQIMNERKQLEVCTQQDLLAVQEAEESMKLSASDTVQELNLELAEVEALGMRLVEEAKKVDAKLLQAIGNLEGVEEGCLSRIRTLVEADCRSLKEVIGKLMVQAGPMYSLSQSEEP